MTNLFIAASPLVKLFLKEWHPILEEHPEQLYSTKPFSFAVNRGSSSIIVEFNKPMMVPPSLARDEKEILNVFNWLTGGPESTECQETDWTGIVAFDPKIDMISTMDQIASIEEGEDDKAALKRLKAARAHLAETKAKVLDVADERIRRTLRNMYNNLHKQWQANKETGQGVYPPSITEKLAAFVLDAQIRRAEERGEKLNKRMNEIMSKNFGV